MTAALDHAGPRARGAEEGAPALEILDALGGLVRVTKRSPTLDGGVPVRVAQGCAPLLEGNALGFQIVLTRPLHLRARWGKLEAAWSGEDREDLERRCRAALPRLAARGYVEHGGPWARALAARPLEARGARVRLWTGLLVRPAPGVWLRVSSCANRRNRLVDVAASYVAGERFVPLVLEISLAHTRGPVRLMGEIASVIALAPGGSIERQELDDAPELARAHAAFYDRTYFQTKKARVDAKYRRLLKREHEATLTSSPRARVVAAGPAPFAIDPARSFLTAGSTTLAPRGAAELDLPSVSFANAVPFRATFDGHSLDVTEDARALALGALAVRRAFERACGARFATEHQGALLYLTKYFTPHPPGEPHFFVKPWAFLETPPGWSTLVEGVHGDGYDVLRGVVATDRFHATPAVFALHHTGRAIDVPAGAPLLRAIPFPRELARRSFAEVSWS